MPLEPITSTPGMQTPPPTPWYRTWNGRLFLGCLGGIALLGILFGGLVGYYAWQIKRGNGAEIEASLRNQKFTLDRSRTTKTSAPERIDSTAIIRPHSPTLSSADAPITIVQFIDFECPYSREAFTAFEQTRSEFEPITTIVFKHLPLASIHPDSMSAAVAATCAHEQGAFWNYYEQLFTDKKLDSASLLATAERLQLNMNTFRKCFTAETHRGDIEQDMQDAIAIGVRGTPTYIVNGKKIEGVLTADEWRALLIDEITTGGPAAE